MTRDANTAFARTLVDEWVRCGCRDAVLSPGSRSAPLALALADDGRLRLHVVLDERAAGFLALGLAVATGAPAIVLCTSGTAPANLHPAVLEASHARRPMIVCTADRPPELRDVGAGQTVDQVHLFGSAVRWFAECEVPSDRPGAGKAWRSLACRAVASARGPVPGPVHLDLPFREPLVPTGADLVDAPGRPDGAPWTRVLPAAPHVEADAVAALAARLAAVERGVIVAGWGSDVPAATVTALADRLAWPVLADPCSGARVPGTVGAYEALLRVPGFADARRPDLVLRVGAPLTSKTAGAWLASVPTVLVDPHTRWLDPHRGAVELVPAAGAPLLAALADRIPTRAGRAWHTGWHDAERSARDAIDAAIDAIGEVNEPGVARDVVAALPSGAALAVASSMPVRDVEGFAAPMEGLTLHANRGVNGIDGFVATTLGLARGRAATGAGPTVGLCGDLCFLHDGGGLLAAGAARDDVTFVVVDNDGGGIFSFLPQAALPHHFETLFGTPSGGDLAAIAAAYGFTVRPVTAPADLALALRDAIGAGGPQVLHVRTRRDANVAHHQAIWAAVEARLAPAPPRIDG